METEMLYALRDPLGVPSHPLLFLVLGVLSWAAHITAVHVLMGSSVLTVYGSLSKQPHWRRLAAAMVNTAKVAISVAIVLGVAPLLFVQVIYDPFWYTSNVLSAWWVIGFIIILILATVALFVFYAMNKTMDMIEKTRCPGSMIVAIALFIVVGFIMHVLAVQMLHPEKWMEWYAPDGVIDPSGRSIHEFNLWRFGFFMALSIPVTGLWLYAYRRYLMAREQEDADYLEFIKRLAARWGTIGGVISLAFFIAWMLTLPENIAGFATGIWPVLTILALAAAVAFPMLIARKLDIGLWGYAPFGVGIIAGLVIATMREAVRWQTLFGVHGYNPLDYKVHMDWYSTILFFATLVIMGGAVLGYLITVAWKAGQTKGVYTPSPAVNRLGTFAIFTVAFWIVQYFGFGLWVGYM